MSRMKPRKPIEMLSKAGRWIREREAAGLPLSPSLQRGTLKYAQSKGWNSIQQRTVNGIPVYSRRNASHLRKRLRVEFTRQEFDAWVAKRWNEYERLYASGATPSVDRINNSIGYTLDNLRVIDLKENMAKDRRKPVVGVNVTTGVEMRFSCGKEAAETLGLASANVSSAAYRIGGTCGGWRWSFENKAHANRRPVP